MLIKAEDYIAHIGTPRHSGRYPYGSGKDPQANKTFLDTVADLEKKGLTPVEIVKGLDLGSTTRLRALKSIAKNAQKQEDIATAEKLAAKHYSNVAIGVKMAINGVPRNESTIRALREPGAKDKADILTNTANMLKEQVKEKKYVQIGLGVEHTIGVGISKQKLDTAAQILVEQGYRIHTVQTPQLGTLNQKTLVKVLTPPGTEYPEVAANIKDIRLITNYSEDGGRSFLGLLPPIQVNSKRIEVKYNEDGGGKEDGMIYVRPGMKDLSLGRAHYAQVRISVDNTHYLKGMAMYRDDLPPGVDLQFYTKKSKNDPDIKSDLDAMKPTKKLKDGTDDPDNPYGSIVRQIGDHDAAGNLIKLTSAMNLVNEEGSWEGWNDALPSQMLSKQSPRLAKLQLDKTFEEKKADFDEIMTLTNPAVKKKLLETSAAAYDKSAVQLHAAHLPRQGTHVLLPIKSMKETEIYAPNFLPGERVVLIRFPHGGTFEIPELTVNNNQPLAKKLIGPGAKDAVGINAKVAARLSGADFDGDTVLVIPNNPNNRDRIKNRPALESLIGFDPIASYPKYDGMEIMTPSQKGLHMGMISNLITDMTIKGANEVEIAHAVKHSMVVIDAEKHKLNYKQSAIDNGVSGLKVKYQNSSAKSSARGATTLISRAKARKDIPEAKLRKPRYGGPIDPKTGKLVWIPTNKSYPEMKNVKDPITKQLVIDPKTGKPLRVPTGKTIYRTMKTKKLLDTDDARTLISKPGTEIEQVYADHSNRLKDLANQARKASVFITTTPYDKSAFIAYRTEVDSLSAKLKLANKNAPLEKQAQILANAIITLKKQDNKDMDSKELKKLEYLALKEQRHRLGANKKLVEIEITPKEWQAIQAGAITNAKLEAILKNTNLKTIRQLATPRTKVVMTTAKVSRAQAMIANGATMAAVANALGVSLSTLKSTIGEIDSEERANAINY